MRERERVPYKQKYLEQSESEAKEYGSEKKQGVKKQLFRFLLPTEPKTKKKQKPQAAGCLIHIHASSLVFALFFFGTFRKSVSITLQTDVQVKPGTKRMKTRQK